jgi:tetratricopeptide (TPR) repeat protein
MTWSATLARDPKVDPGDQLKLMEKALAVDPANMDLIMQLWAFTKLKGEAGEKARAVLRAQLANGKGSGLVHLALGMDAWDEGKQDAALIHLEQAYKLSPQLGIVANNLAWVLANSNPPDLERALALINTVLREYPNDAMCRDTRGQILFRMGKHKEALTEFQAVLPVLRNDPGLHERLAETYDKLGLVDMAAEHRNQVKKLSPGK